MFRGLSFATWGFMHLPLEETVKKIAEIGYDGIEFWVSEPYKMLKYEEKTVKSVAKLVEEHGLKSVSICPDYMERWWETGRGVKPTEKPGNFIEVMHRNMDIAADLGCKKCNIHSMNTPHGLKEEDAWRNLVTSFQGCVDIAEKLGLTLCYEAEPGMSFGRPKETLNLVKELGSKNFTLLFDTTLMYVLSNGDPINALMNIKSDIGHVHLSDQDETVNNLRSMRIRRTMDLLKGRVALGKGVIDIRGTIETLKKIGYTDWLTVEPAGITLNAEQAAATSREYVQSLI